MISLAIPSPPQNVWHLGPVPIRAYALCILAGIVVAWLIARRRWRRLGGDVEKLENLLLVMVVSGIAGARLYYVLIEWGRFFGPNGTWYAIFFVWQGGLGIWGGLVGGGLAAWLMARHYRFRLPVLLDVIAPTLPLAQAMGRFGNYFNQELYGRPTSLPWGLEIDPAHRVAGFFDQPTFHPTFLYESAWNIALALVLVLVIERRLHWGRGKLFASYIVGYALGRFAVESFRIDPVKVLGPFRINAWVTLVLGLTGLAGLVWLAKHRPGPNQPGDAVAVALAREQTDVGDEAEADSVTGADEGAADDVTEAAAEGATGDGVTDVAEVEEELAGDVEEEPAGDGTDPMEVAEESSKGEVATGGAAEDGEGDGVTDVAEEAAAEDDVTEVEEGRRAT